MFWFLGLVWDFCFALFVLFFFFIKIWFNYFLSTMPEIQTLSWLRKLKFHMVLLSPGKASFNLANWIVSYFLFCQIFSHRDRVCIEWQKNWPAKPPLGVVWEKEENKQLYSECSKALLWVLQISITIQAQTGQKFCFLPVWIKICFDATKGNFFPGKLRMAFIHWAFILSQPDKLHGSISASAHFHWLSSLNSSHSLMLLGAILLHLQSTGVPPALLFPFAVISGTAYLRGS